MRCGGIRAGVKGSGVKRADKVFPNQVEDIGHPRGEPFRIVDFKDVETLPVRPGRLERREAVKDFQ